MTTTGQCTPNDYIVWYEDEEGHEHSDFIQAYSLEQAQAKAYREYGNKVILVEGI